MRKLAIALAVSVGLLGFGAPQASAQIPWESTLLLSPSAPAGFSAHLVRFDYSIANTLGGLITYRPVTGAGGVGYRVAFAEGNINREMAVAGGVDFSGLLSRRNEHFPVDLMWFAGFGGGFSDYATVGVPFGLAFGRPVDGRAAWFNPYLSTRGVLEYGFGDWSPPDEGATLAVAVDVGADLALGSSRALVLRLGASLGDRQTLVVGFNMGGR
ncbi:MAG: hypothetical protein HKN73_05380 [Gemmatimonadetes bacterium]|nr:hypothetical protein [Gemmatimonadota bacterium]